MFLQRTKYTDLFAPILVSTLRRDLLTELATPTIKAGTSPINLCDIYHVLLLPSSNKSVTYIT